MSLFISDAFAQTAAQAEPGIAANLIPLLLIFAIFYFLLIRPQQKKIKEHGVLVDGLKRGDEVIFSGILGKVAKVEEGTNIIQVEIAPDVVVRINRNSVSDIGNKDEKKAEAAAKKTDKKK